MRSPVDWLVGWRVFVSLRIRASSLWRILGWLWDSRRCTRWVWWRRFFPCIWTIWRAVCHRPSISSLARRDSSSSKSKLKQNKTNNLNCNNIICKQKQNRENDSITFFKASHNFHNGLNCCLTVSRSNLPSILMSDRRNILSWPMIWLLTTIWHERSMLGGRPNNLGMSESGMLSMTSR